MILGIGSDIIDIRRIEKTLTRFGARFEQRIFSASEQQKADKRGALVAKAKAATLAKRFAAKEACSKALGTGMRLGVAWRDMEVVNTPTGKPTMALSGPAAHRLREITPPGMSAQIDVTLTDEYPYAQAYVIISAV